MDLSVNYLGYTLKNPIIIGSSGLTNSAAKIKKLAENGAGAIVLKSLFEEQINQEASHQQIDYGIAEAYDYIKEYNKSFSIDNYLKLIEDSRKVTDIPIIASINAIDNGSWINFAKKAESAGAHAIEVNIGMLPTNIDVKCSEIEKLHLEILESLKKELSIPLAVKISSFSSGLAHLVKQIAWSKTAESIVMFNRFYNPDVDIFTLEMKASNVFSDKTDEMPSLRWIALLAEKFENTQFVASTGVYYAEEVIKQILVGANAVQIVSAIYKNGEKYIQEIIRQIKTWMEENNYHTISDFKGKLSMSKLENPNIFERIQFMKYYGSID